VDGGIVGSFVFDPARPSQPSSDETENDFFLHQFRHASGVYGHVLLNELDSFPPERELSESVSLSLESLARVHGR
jgi:hypothetical protein